MAARLRILLIDDHRLFAEALVGVLGGLGDGEPRVEHCASAEEALAVLDRGARFDLVLLDLGLPKLRGREAFAAIQARAPNTPVVIVTASEPSAELHALVRDGARGVVHKGARTAELLSVLRFVLEGGTHVPPELLRVPAPADEPALTPRQREVLEMLARGASNKDIANTLGISEATVRVHVSCVLRELGVENRTQAATSAYARRLVGG